MGKKRQRTPEIHSHLVRLRPVGSRNNRGLIEAMGQRCVRASLGIAEFLLRCASEPAACSLPARKLARAALVAHSAARSAAACADSIPDVLPQRPHQELDPQQSET